MSGFAYLIMNHQLIIISYLLGRYMYIKSIIFDLLSCRRENFLQNIWLQIMTLVYMQGNEILLIKVACHSQMTKLNII